MDVFGTQHFVLCWEVVLFQSVLYQRFHCMLSLSLAIEVFVNGAPLSCRASADTSSHQAGGRDHQVRGPRGGPDPGTVGDRL